MRVKRTATRGFLSISLLCMLCLGYAPIKAKAGELILAEGQINNGKIIIQNGGKLTVVGEDNIIANHDSIVICNSGEIDGVIRNLKWGDDVSGSFRMERDAGKVTGVANMDENCVIQIDGGVVEEGISIENGELYINGGTVKAPDGGSAVSMNGPNAKMEIAGGEIINEYGGSAIYIRSGTHRIHVSNEQEGIQCPKASIRAREPLKTIDMEEFEPPSGIDRELLSGFYVTEWTSDGMAELITSGGSLAEAVAAVNQGYGDTITLSGDMTDTMSAGTIMAGTPAGSGTAESPVILDLNGKSLTFANDGVILQIYENAFWRILNGSLNTTGASPVTESEEETAASPGQQETAPSAKIVKNAARQAASVSSDSIKEP